MTTNLKDLPTFPDEWARALKTFGYETVEEFVSACQLDGGRESLADVLECSVEEVQDMEGRLAVETGLDVDGLKPVDYPLGALPEGEEE